VNPKDEGRGLIVPTSVVRLQAEQKVLIVPTVKKTVGIPKQEIGAGSQEGAGKFKSKS